MFLSGDHDMLVPFLGTQDWIRSLNYSIIEDWRPWMVHNQVTGYYTIFFCHFYHRNILEDHQFVFVADTQELMPIR